MSSTQEDDHENANLATLLTTDIRTELPPQPTAKILSQRPFVTIPGLFNLRDLSTPQDDGPPAIRPGFIYRSGALTHITPAGKTALVDTLHLGTIFDLRRPEERARAPSPDIPGVETIWVPYAFTPMPVNPRDFAGPDGGVSGFVKMYLAVLECAEPAFQAVFQQIRDHPERPLLFHCSAGKDRTGVIAALIEKLAGCSDDAVVHDYLLTRIGVEPARQALLGFLRGQVGAPVSEEMPGLVELCSVQAAAMRGFLKALDGMFEGGAIGYVTIRLGFSDEDVEVIRRNLLHYSENQASTRSG